MVVEAAEVSGLGAQRCASLALAVSEAVTNALQHGGSATVVVYESAEAVMVEVHDQADIEIPDLPAQPPSQVSLRGRGLWLARQMCDRVEIMRHRTGNAVRLVMNL